VDIWQCIINVRVVKIGAVAVGSNCLLCQADACVVTVGTTTATLGAVSTRRPLSLISHQLVLTVRARVQIWRASATKTR